MLEAYRLAEDSIKWCIIHKLDGSNDTKAINYGMSIMLDKLNEAFTRRQNKKRQHEQFERTKVSDQSKSIETINKNKKKHIDEMDISSFL
jgi:hypothetical protein